MLKSTKGQNLVYFSFKLIHTRALWFQRRRSFSHFKSMRANAPRGVANLDPRGMVGRIYAGDHLTLLHTKYLSSGPYGFREENFLSFSHFKSIGVNEPWGVGKFGPKGHGWQNLCREPLNIATYLRSKLWALWFQRRFVNFFFPIISLWEHGQLGP